MFKKTSCMLSNRMAFGFDYIIHFFPINLFVDNSFNCNFYTLLLIGKCLSQSGCGEINKDIK